MDLNWCICLALCISVSAGFVWKHHNNEELPVILEEIHEKCPNITRVYALTEPSVLNVPLYVIEFSDNPGFHQPYKPEVKYVGNIHGNEVLGRELLLGLADYLCDRYNQFDKRIRALIHTTRIHLLPSMNPDGWQAAYDVGGRDYLIGRANNHSVDLNRNFPDLDAITFELERQGISHNNHLLQDLSRLTAPDCQKTLEPETRAVMRWIMSIPFVLSAALHGGDLVANYPYDESRSGAPTSEYSASPDDETFRELALTYAMAHEDMASTKRKGCDIDGDTDSDSYNFGKQGGVTNGAAWYSLKGGMQDFNYLATNAFEITLELGCLKFPPASSLSREWERNKEALLAYMFKAHIGVKGIVSDDSGFIQNAIISVVNITGSIPRPIRHDITTGPFGDYYRLLTPGHYEVTASFPGYFPISRVITVPPYQMSALIVDFKLEPTTSWFDDETLFGVYPNGLRDGQPRIYKRSLYEKVTKTLLNHKNNAYEKHSTAN
ncbi:carboxypeptidase E-like isoform X4 [Hyposmocoma kahamanoa]|uniref:carboxypeptidase E-like isoform X4 n=1 Tax=Hyposmocoma kahamanoa TaxID=1477025 RepID=UPI000E6D8AAE|nr:carboxypeptidase E-like isoform X4 [Hyposmocoma kahamanoa]